MQHLMTPSPLTRKHSLRKTQEALARAIQPLAASRFRSRPIEPLESRLLLSADTACISAVAFLDRNANGQREEAREEALAGWTVFLDANGNGQLDTGERSATTDQSGLALFDEVPPGAYRVTQVSRSTWVQTSPGMHSVLVKPDDVCQLAFGNTLKGYPVLAAMGDELAVPTVENGQTAPSVAMDDAGNYVVVWQSYTDSIYREDIFAQRFDAAGQRLGSEIRINAYRRGAQNQPVVAMDLDGDFVVAWSSADSGHGGVFAQRFDSQGQPMGSEFRVSAKAISADQQPAITMGANGKFVIAWARVVSPEDTDLYARQYDAAGMPQGGDISVAAAINLESYPDVAVLPDGEFVVTWQVEHGASETDICARRYSSAGIAHNAEFLVNTFVANRQSRPTIATTPSGDFVIAWESAGQDGDAGGIYAQRYNAAGQRQGGEFHVSATTIGTQEMPDIAVAANGGFVITWSSPQDGGSMGIYAQQYTAAGEKVSNEFRVNAYVPDSQSDPAIAMNGNGDAVIVWSSSSPQGGRSAGVYAQRYASIVGSATLGGQVWKDADGDGVQDPDETGMAGVTVKLLTGAGQLLTTVNSSDDGSYRFEGLQPGESYQLEFVVPFDWTLSLRDQGADDTLDSDVDIATARTVILTPAPAQVDLHLDAGLMQMALVRGMSFNDLDGDGVRNPGDPGIAGRTIYIDANGNGQLDAGEVSLTTDPDGTYHLENLRPGVYRIGQIAEDQWKPTGSADGFRTITLTPGEWLENLDFGSQSLTPTAHSYPLGPEVLVSEPGNWAAYNNFSPSVAMNAAGESVAVWQVYFYPDHDTCGIYAQRYNAAGTPQGGKFYVANSADDNAMLPVVAMDDAGNFVVAWQDQTHIDARLYSAADDSWGEEFRVGNDENMWEMALPSVAMDPAGDFVIAWQAHAQAAAGYDIYALRYDSEGTPRGEVLLVNDRQEQNQTSPSVAMDAAGNFVVAWEDQNGRGNDGSQVFARRFTAAGESIGDAFLATELNTNYQVEPALAMGKDGDFVIAWRGYWSEDPNASDIYAQWFNAAAQPQGPTTLISSSPSANETDPAIALSGTGDCVITWQIRTGDSLFQGDYDVYMRTYDAMGVPQGYEQRVHLNGAGAQLSPAVAADADGDFVIVWEMSNSLTDTAADDDWGDFWPIGGDNGHEIHAQRFWWIADPVVVNGLAWKDLDANGARDPGEPLLAGITINLLSASGDVLTSTITDANGWYSFNNVRPGSSYFIQAVAPSGMLFTQSRLDLAEDANSDVDITTGRSIQFTLTTGQAPKRIDAGLIQQALISGVVFNDSNNSGSHDVSESGLANWIAYLDGNSNGQRDPDEPFAITAQDGSYSIAGLHPGTYRVGLVPQDHWKQTTPADRLRSVTLSVGQLASNIDFGNHTTIPDTTCTPVGDEFRVNVGTGLDETIAGVAMDAAGNFVVTFMRIDHRMLEFGLFARRYSAAGQSLGDELQILPPGEDQVGGSVAMDAAGNFAVIWTAWEAETQQDVYMQRYNAAGAPQGEPIRVNSHTPGDQTSPIIRMDPAGNTTVFWLDHGLVNDQSHAGVYARRFNAAGQPLGEEFRLTSSSGNLPNLQSVAMDSSGNFLIAYSNWSANDRPVGVYLQRYNAAGVRQGSEIFTNATSYRPDVALADDGDFVLAWDSLTPNVDGLEVFAQHYNAANVPQGAAFRVNTYTKGFQEGPVLRMDPDGGFVIVWTSADQDGSGLGVYACRYNAAGLSQGEEFCVNTTTLYGQNSPMLAMDADGDFVIAWSSNGQDGAEQGVYAQRYEVQKPGPIPDIIAVDPDPRSNPLAQVQIVFNEPVTGFDLPDLSLTCNGSPLLLTPAQMLSTVDGRTWTLTNLTPLTSTEGQYTLSLRAEGSGITGRSGKPLTISASESFTVTATSIQGTPGNDVFEIRRDGANVQIVLISGSVQKTYSFAIDAISALNIDGLGGDDSFLIDYTYGNPSSAQGLLRLHGGDQGDSFNAGDRLTIMQNALGGHYIPSATEFGSGSLNLGGGTVEFTGMESILAQGAAAFTLVTPNPDDHITINPQEHDRNWVSGTSGGVAFVPLTLGSHQDLLLDLAAHDAGAGNDTVDLPLGMAEGTCLSVVGGSGDNQVTIGGGIVNFMPMVGNAVPPVDPGFLPLVGNFALTVKGDAHAVVSTGTGVTELSIQDHAKVRIDADIFSVLRLKGLSITGQGTLDLDGNELIISVSPSNQDAALFQISQLIGSARNASTGRWTGTGITSTLLAAIPLLGLVPTLDGDTILVKHTWNGDVNCDGKVDAADYFLIDSGFLTQKGGYRNGDFNFDGVVDAADYFLIDSAFLAQNAQAAG